MPAYTATAAPGKPAMATVCPAKVWRRSTMNQPTTPAVTAMIVPARYALTMNGYDHSSWMSRTRFQLKPTSAGIGDSAADRASCAGCAERGGAAVAVGVQRGCFWSADH